ncbi:MAG: hypothetical protein IPH44_35385 [Myxococcales bacterium]|jgi:hypothetical protein|nr:hypothetical protein [Myxococcales bacterium]MBK7194723.1 hypothetical protein [Myxococcales bacterium]MBP6846377.1 hypothetical protein [Kofleriaceae bacterium]
MLQVIDERSPDGAIRLRPLRRAVFERMCQCGDVDAAELELVCGAVIDRRDDDPERARAVAQVAARLRAQAGPAGRVAVRAAWALDDYSMPRPDVRVAATGGHCELGVSATPLVVEVARRDGGGAARHDLYARAPLAEYWQVDLDAAVIEAWRGRDARFGTWATVTRYSRGEVACHATRPALALSIDELLARPRGAQRLRWRPGAATPSP